MEQVDMPEDLVEELKKRKRDDEEIFEYINRILTFRDKMGRDLALDGEPSEAEKEYFGWKKDGEEGVDNQ